MKNILLLDTAFASFNKGDDIIMECTRKELASLLEPNFELNLPTHVSAFHWYPYSFKKTKSFYRVTLSCLPRALGVPASANP